jgi:hypothetical protein
MKKLLILTLICLSFATQLFSQIKPITLHNPLVVTGFSVKTDTAYQNIVHINNGSNPHLIYNLSNRLEVDSYYGIDMSSDSSITMSAGSFIVILRDSALCIPALSINGGPAITTFGYISSTNLTRINASKIHLIPRSAAPSPAEAGDIYYDSDDNKHYGYNGSTWTALY